MVYNNSLSSVEEGDNSCFPGHEYYLPLPASSVVIPESGSASFYYRGSGSASASNKNRIRIRINLQMTSRNVRILAYFSTFSRVWAFIWKLDLDLDPHQGDKSNLDPHQDDKSNPDPHHGDKSNPDPH